MVTPIEIAKPIEANLNPQFKEFETAFGYLAKAGFITHLSNYDGQSGRLLGLKAMGEGRREMAKNSNVLLKIPQIIPLKDALFRHYLEHGHQFAPEVEKNLLTLIERQMSLSETRRLSVRRAYWNTQENKLLGNTRFNGLPPDSQEVLATIKNMYELEPVAKNWDKDPAITVDLMLQEFTNTEYALENGKFIHGEVPYGGAAWFDPGQSSVFVEVCCGDNRSITVHNDLIDKFRLSVNNGRGVRIEERRNLNHRPVMYLDRGDGLVEIKLPRELQVNFTPINDFNLTVVGQLAYEMYKKFGQTMKIEFSAGRKGLYFNEVAPLVLKSTEIKVEPLDVTSRIYGIIEKMEDVHALRDHQPKQTDYPPVIYLPPEALENNTNLRNMLVELRKLQEKKTKSGVPAFVYLVKSGQTSHAFRDLTVEFNLNVVDIAAQQEFGIGDRVRIVRKPNGQSTVYNITLAGSEKYFYLQQYPVELRATEIGNKAYSVDFLHELGFATPPAYVLSEDFFHDFLTANNVSDIWFSLSNCKTVTELKEQFAKLRETPKMPADWDRLEKMLHRKFGDGLEKMRFAVRSSGIIEDLETRAFAGTFYTGLNVEFANLAEEVRKVMQSPFTDKIAESIFGEDPTTGREILNRLSMPVLIHPLVDAKWSGTVFHCDPINNLNTRVITIEAEPGVGGVVGSEIRGTRLNVKFDSYTRKLLSITITTNTRQIPLESLEDLAKHNIDFPVEEIIALRETAAAVCDRTGKPYDIEWAYGTLNSHADQMWYTQARPIKTT